jgi:alpha-galactosidase
LIKRDTPFILATIKKYVIFVNRRYVPLHCVYKKYLITMNVMRYPFLLLLSFVFCLAAQAQSPIVIATANSALMLKENKDHRLYQQYFGARLDNAADYDALPATGHQAYVSAGMDDLFTPAIRMVHTDGNPSLELQYVSAKQEKQGDDMTSTVVLLKDPQYPVEVELHYEAYYQEDVIKAWTVIRQNEKQPVTLTNFATTMLHFNAPHYWLTQFHGDWASEMKMEESELTSGIKTIDTKLGTRADMYRTPVFFLSMDKESDETSGEVIAGTLAWTGNFQFLFEVDEKKCFAFVGGDQSLRFRIYVAAGEGFCDTSFYLYIQWSRQRAGQPAFP